MSRSDWWRLVFWRSIDWVNGKSVIIAWAGIIMVDGGCDLNFVIMLSLYIML